MNIQEIDGTHGIARTENALRSVLPGDVDGVRARLIQAVEQMGYTVITDEPLFARRRARGGGRYYLSADILDYPMKLTIGLRRISPDTTLVTFDYVAEHAGSISFRGDKSTLAREAEAVIALATSEMTPSACGACGTKQISEGRFCRICGAPTVVREPAELEILRLTAGARAGHHLIVTGALLATLALLASIVIGLFGLAGSGVIGGLVGVQLVGLFMVFAGLYGQSKTLDPRRTSVATGEVGKKIASSDVQELTDAPRASITEGTTNLLPRIEKREQQPVYAKKRDTTPMDD